MGVYIFRRLLASIPVLLGIIIITFILARSVPGHPCEKILGEKATLEMCENLLKSKGIDKPIPVQLGIYIMDVIQGEFGNSIRFNRPVVQILVERLPATVELSLTAFFIAVAIGIPAGLFQFRMEVSIQHFLFRTFCLQRQLYFPQLKRNYKKQSDC